MARKIIISNQDKFFENCKMGEVFTYAERYIPQELIEMASLFGVVVEYCPPNTPEYKEHGCNTMKVINIPNGKKTGKVAKIVYVSLATRVVVDENASWNDMLEAAKEKFHAKINNELNENVEEIKDDKECPYDSEHDD